MADLVSLVSLHRSANCLGERLTDQKGDYRAIAGEANVEVIRHLLARGAKTDIFDSNGHACLHTAAFHDEHLEIIRLLIEHGAQVNEPAKNEGQHTPLALALEKGNENVAELLRRHGADHPGMDGNEKSR